jgi:hypothetical protein
MSAYSGMEVPRSPPDEVSSRLREVFDPYSPSSTYVIHSDILPTPYASRRPESTEFQAKGKAEIETIIRDIFQLYSTGCNGTSGLDRTNFLKLGKQCRILDGNLDQGELFSIFEDYAADTE